MGFGSLKNDEELCPDFHDCFMINLIITYPGDIVYLLLKTTVLPTLGLK